MGCRVCDRCDVPRVQNCVVVASVARRARRLQCGPHAAAYDAVLAGPGSGGCLLCFLQAQVTIHFANPMSHRTCRGRLVPRQGTGTRQSCRLAPASAYLRSLQIVESWSGAPADSLRNVLLVVALASAPPPPQRSTRLTPKHSRPARVDLDHRHAAQAELALVKPAAHPLHRSCCHAAARSSRTLARPFPEQREATLRMSSSPRIRAVGHADDRHTVSRPALSSLIRSASGRGR